LKSRLVCVILLCIFLMLSLSLAFNLSYVHSEAVTEIVAPFAKKPATADGFLAPGEWDDARIFGVGTKKNYGYLYVKHNWTVLWVFLDYVSDEVKNPKAWDNGWVAIDHDMSRGEEPEEYDLLFHEAGHGVWIGDGVAPIGGSQWGTFIGHGGPSTPEAVARYNDSINLIKPFFAGSGPSWGTTEASDTLHAYCELQVPLNWLEDANSVGFAASMQDQDTTTIIDWPETKSAGDFWPGPDDPSTGKYMPPSEWGTLTLSSQSLGEKQELPTIEGEEPTEIPYLYIIVAVVGVVVVVSAVVLAMRRRK
jgi:hypothetical protein